MKGGFSLINFEKLGLPGPIDMVLNILLMFGIVYVLWGVVHPYITQLSGSIGISATVITVVMLLVLYLGVRPYFTAVGYRHNYLL